VARIFRELQGAYGSRFLDMWKSGHTENGMDTGMANAHEKWARELAGFADQPERLSKALQSLPEYPPTLPEFKALARQQSVTLQNTLPAPTPDAERRAANLERAASVSIKEAPGLAWAYRIRDKHRRGERLHKCQTDLASAVLGREWSA
jgi:hypothetical protein